MDISCSCVAFVKKAARDIKEDSVWHPIPYKCPVCEGAGKKFVAESTPSLIRWQTEVDCHACKGKGLVWSHVVYKD